MRQYLIILAACFSQTAFPWGFPGAFADGFPAAAPDLALLAENCASCHSADFRPLAQMDERQLLQTLGSLKSGERQSTIMARILSPFSAAELAELAEYIAADPGTDKNE